MTRSRSGAAILLLARAARNPFVSGGEECRGGRMAVVRTDTLTRDQAHDA